MIETEVAALTAVDPIRNCRVETLCLSHTLVQTFVKTVNLSFGALGRIGNSAVVGSDTSIATFMAVAVVNDSCAKPLWLSVKTFAPFRAFENVIVANFGAVHFNVAAVVFDAERAGFVACVPIWDGGIEAVDIADVEIEAFV